MTCPFCGAKETGVTGEFDESVLFECGSEACPEEQELSLQSDICQELCRLREKRAKGLAWMDFSPTISRALGIAGTGWAIVTRHDGIAVWMDEEPAAEGFKTLAAAKAHAEELHQQAWRELRTRWDAK